MQRFSRSLQPLSRIMGSASSHASSVFDPSCVQEAAAASHALHDGQQQLRHLATDAAVAADAREQSFESRDGGSDVRQQTAAQSQAQARWQSGRSKPSRLPRNPLDYLELFRYVTTQHRNFLTRDILEEMQLRGMVVPREMLYLGILGNGKSKRLGDAMFFFEELQRRGYEVKVRDYTAAINAAGRAGQLRQAVQLKQRMEREGLEPSPGTYLALLSALATAGHFRSSQTLFLEMVSRGIPPGPMAYAHMIDAYKNAEWCPPDYAEAVLDLMDRSKVDPDTAAEVAEAQRRQLRGDAQRYTPLSSASPAHEQRQEEEEEGEGGDEEEGTTDAQGEGRYGGGVRMSQRRSKQREQQGLGHFAVGSEGVSLVVYKAAINALQHRGYHALAVELFARLRPQGLHPDGTAYAWLMYSYCSDALGDFRPGGRLHSQAAFSSEELTPVADAGNNLARAVDVDEEMIGTSAAVAAAAASGRGLLKAGGDVDDDALEGGDTGGDGDNGDAWRDGDGGPAPGQQQQQGDSRAAGLPPYVIPRGQRLEERVLSSILRKRERVNLDSWRAALALMEEAQQLDLQLGPDLYYRLMETAIQLDALQVVPDGIETATRMLKDMLDKDIYVNVDDGSELLRLGAKLQMRHLGFAHAIWDAMRAQGRLPRTRGASCYHSALKNREPNNMERIADAMQVIRSDPNYSRMPSHMR